MRGWRHLFRRLKALPLLMQAGLTILVSGGAGDLLSHSIRQLARFGYHFHLLTFAGMVITVLGLLIDAGLQRKPRPPRSGQPDSF